MFAALRGRHRGGAGPCAAGPEGDRRRHPERRRRDAGPRRGGVRCSARWWSGRRASPRPTSSTGSGNGRWPTCARRSSATCRRCRSPSTSAGPPGADLADDERRRRAQLARHRHGDHSVPGDADVARLDRDPAPVRRRAGAPDLPHLPRHGRRVAGLPHRQRRCLPAHARDDRRDHRRPAGDALGHPGRARLRPGAAPPAPLRRLERGQPPGQPGHGEPQRGVLPRRRAHQRAGHRSGSSSSAA